MRQTKPFRTASAMAHCVCAVALFGFASQSAHAQGDAPAPVLPPPQLTYDQAPQSSILPPTACEPERSWLTSCAIGARTWISWGDSDRNHAARAIIGGVPFFADPISDLRWKNTVSAAGEVNASALFFNRLVASSTLGVGGIDGGRFRDQDFALSGRQGLFSDTVHPIDSDDLLYGNADLGWQLYGGDYCAVNGLIGYQYWREKYVAEGGSVIVPAGSTFLFPPGPVISEQFTWQGLRLGAQGYVTLSERCALKSLLVLMPLMHLEVRDIHFLRDDLRKDPSIVDRATGGFGLIYDLRLSYRVWRGLSAEIGYRIFDATSGNGETIFRFNEGDSRVPFNEGNTTRQGLTLGLNYYF
jgi:hypothetical protein